MRFILREYLLSLKEDNELDRTVTELLRSMKIIPLTNIQRGRQHGVDISAIGIDKIDNQRKLFLLVIKQGNLSRTNWSIKVNDVKPSLDEVLDTYIPTQIADAHKHLKKKIIVCCNGYKDQTVNLDWIQYTNARSSESIEFDFWGIDQLVDFAETYQLNEALISPDLSLLFRRALSFIDLPDYNLEHLYKFVDGLLPNENNLSISRAIKKLRLVNVCLGIIISWCEQSNNLKPAYIASERILLTTWGWLIKSDVINNKNVFGEFYKIIFAWKELGLKYVLKTRDYFAINEGLSRGILHHQETCILTFEQIGIIGCIGLFELWEAKIKIGIENEDMLQAALYDYSVAESISETLIDLIQNNSSSNYLLFDEYCIEVTIALTLISQTGKYPHAILWLKNLIEYLLLKYKFTKNIPAFYANIDYILNSDKEQIDSSMLIYILAEWCLVLKQKNLYELIRKFHADNIPKVNLQIWYPEKDIDDYLFTSNASLASGTTKHSISLPEDILQLEMLIAEERVEFSEEINSSIYQHGVDFLSFLAFRHYRTLPFPNIWRNAMSTNFCFSKKGYHVD